MVWWYLAITIYIIIQYSSIIRIQEKRHKAQRLELLEQLDKIGNQNMKLRQILRYNNIEIKF